MSSWIADAPVYQFAESGREKRRLVQQRRLIENLRRRVEYDPTRQRTHFTRRRNDFDELVARQFCEQFIFHVTRFGVCDGNDVGRAAMQFGGLRKRLDIERKRNRFGRLPALFVQHDVETARRVTDVDRPRRAFERDRSAFAGASGLELGVGRRTYKSPLTCARSKSLADGFGQELACAIEVERPVVCESYFPVVSQCDFGFEAFVRAGCPTIATKRITPIEATRRPRLELEERTSRSKSRL